MTTLGPGELGILVGIVLALLVQLLGLVGLILWGRWVSRRHAGSRAARAWAAAAWMPIAALGLHFAGLAGTVLRLTRAFAAVAGADPSVKAVQLADGISSAMILTAIGTTGAAVLLVASIVVFAIGSVLRPRAEVGG